MLEQLKLLNKTTLLHLPGDIEVTLGHMILVIALLLAGYIFSRAVEYLLAKRLASTRLGPDAVIVIKRISFYLILLFVGLTIMSLLGIPMTAFAFATGAIAIGVGFGAQNIINNFISGWILIAERPIRVDDFIEIDGNFGTVQRVGTRSTRIHRSDGVHMLVPNSKLLENTVTNWTLIDHLIRTSLKVGVAYGTNIRLVDQLLQQAMFEQIEIKPEPGPEVILDDFGDNAIMFEVYFWADVTGEKSLRKIRSELRFKIAHLFDENDIVIAFPQRDIHLHTPSPVPVSLVTDTKKIADSKNKP